MWGREPAAPHFAPGHPPRHGGFPPSTTTRRTTHPGGRASKVAAGGARTDERRAVMPWGHRTRIRRTWPDSLRSTSTAATGYVSASTLSLTATCRGRGGTWNWLRPSPRKPRYGRDRARRGRTREAAAMALLQLLRHHPQKTLARLKTWIADEHWLAMRAVAAGIAEPAPLEDNPRKAATAPPKAAFALLRGLAAARDPDVQWIVRENLKKQRLVRADPRQAAALARRATPSAAATRRHTPSRGGRASRKG